MSLSFLRPVLPAVLAFGCCAKPWDAHPMDSAPDEQCRVGSGAAGYDLYIWECVDNEHVVISFFSAEMSCSAPEKETVPCGELTAFEEDYAEQLGGGCTAPPDSLFWE